MKGELEVFKRDDRNIEQRLGFLSEVCFFLVRGQKQLEKP
jgi:hypothetical protein